MALWSKLHRDDDADYEVTWRGDQWRTAPPPDEPAPATVAPGEFGSEILAVLTDVPMTAAAIAERLEMRSQSVASMLLPLVKRGLVVTIARRAARHGRRETEPVLGYRRAAPMSPGPASTEQQPRGYWPRPLPPRVTPPPPVAPITRPVAGPMARSVADDDAREEGRASERARHHFRRPRPHQSALHSVRAHADGRPAQPLRALPTRHVAIR